TEVGAARQRAGAAQSVSGDRLGTCPQLSDLMLYHLLAPLARQHIIFNLFNYITFRAAGATVTSLLVAFIVGPWIIRKLREHRIGQIVRAEGPTSHHGKRGTPTMGGLIILLATIVPTLLWARLDSRYVIVAVIATLWMGMIGFLDDYLKIVRGQSQGLVARWKLVGQVSFGIGLGDAAALLQVHRARAAVVGVSRIRHVRDDGELQRGEPHRRARRSRGGADGHRRRRLRDLLLSLWPRGRRALPRRAPPARRRRAHDFLRCADGGVAGIPLVQRASGAGLHGRHGRARDRGRAGERRDSAQDRVLVADRGRRVRGRDGVGPDSDDHVQVPQEKVRKGICGRPQSLPHGAAASSLRKTRLGRAAGSDAVLHPGCHVRDDRAGDAEGPMTVVPESWRRPGGFVAIIGLGKSGVAASRLLAREGVRVYASDASDHPYAGEAVEALKSVPW